MIRIGIVDTQIMHMLDKLVARAIDQTPVMRRVAGIMAHSVEENFASEGRPKWAALQPATIKAREKKGNWPGKILQQRGDLAASIHDEYDHNSAVVGTNKRYAAIHQLGGTIDKKARSGSLLLRTTASGDLMRQRGHANLAVFGKASHKGTVQRTFTAKAHSITIPARPFLDLTESEKQAIVKAIAKFLV
jgi:phage virion morphogenesis protein